MNSESQTPHIAMLSTPGMGHLIPIAELVKRLVHHHNFSVTIIFFSESNSKAQQSFLNQLPPSVSSIPLPPVDLSHLPPNAAAETRMAVASLRSVPSILTILRQLKLKHNLVAYVPDLFGADTFDAAKELQIPSYVFFPSNFLALSVTIIFFSESNSKAQQSFLNHLPPSVSSISLPPVDLSHLPPNATIETRMAVASLRSVPSVLTILQQLKLKHNLVAYIPDLFGADTFDAAKELQIPSYVFFPSNFLALSVFLNLKKLDEEIKCEFRDMDSPLQLPGCLPIPGEDLLQPVQNRKDEAYAWMVHHGEKYKEAEAILLNTFEELEPGVAKAQSPPVYPIGPLVRIGAGDGADPGNSLGWLDEQPRRSVVFVSFGSGGTLSTEQMRELALGLEMSGQRFLWVARSPNDYVANANYFDSESAREPMEYLPEGFVGRCGGRGMVVPSWASQMEVLGHVGVGGFLTHCGWNSTLESIVRGVPMVAWPLFAEQRQNALMLAEGAKVALRVKFGSDGVARKDDIADVVKELMEGEGGKRARIKVRELQLAAVQALEEGGKSAMNLKLLVEKWKVFGGVV